MKAGFTMKALSLAVLGLAGLGFGANAMAACPTDPAAPNGPWSSKNVAADASLTIVGGAAGQGLNNTACKMSVSINSGALANTRAYVIDDTPADEPHYRARFYMDISGFTGFSLGTYQTRIFNVSSASSPAGISTAEVTAALVGGATPALRFVVADSGQASSFRIVNVPLPAVASGVYRVEIDLTQGSAGAFRYWVTDGSVATSDGSPTGSVTVNNSGWSGATSVNFGLFGTSAGFRANMSGKVLSLDEFDSRRSTFIGQ